MNNNLALIIRYKLLIAIFSLFLIACQSSGLSGSSILYISEKDGNPEIYSMDKNGNNHLRLTNSSKQENSPKLSPDGNSISFISSKNSIRELWLMDFEGNQRKLVSEKDEDVEDFFWSPDSTKIAYKGKNSDGQHDINVYSVSDGSINEVTNNTAIEKLGNWSPDGEWIVYSVIKTDQILDDGDKRVGIFKKNPQGVDEVRLTENFEDHDPMWSPDGKNIAFLSTKGSDYIDIWVIDANSKEETNITASSSNDYDYDWSPDGKRIVFISEREENPEIFVADISLNEKPIRLTDNMSTESSPIWKDGKIIFVSDSDGDTDIYSMTPSDGSGQKRLTNTDQSEKSPSW
jgi:TolB protein